MAGTDTPDERPWAPIPWSDAAVGVRCPKGGEPGDREIFVQGTLGEVVEALSSYTPGVLALVAIALPDRRTAPFRYVGGEITSLLDQRRFTSVRKSGGE